MKINGYKWGICLAAAALVACGGKNNDNNKNSTPNGSTNGMTNGSTNGMTNGMTNGSTNGMTNGMTNGSTGPDADVLEMEPNGFDDGWTSFTPGQSIGGTIATGAGDTSDYDVFSVDLTAGTVVEFGIVETGPGLSSTAVVMLQDEAGEVMTRIAAVSQGPSMRQAYIPLDGTYIVAVYDERAPEDAAEQHGGDDSWYVATLDTTTVTPSSIEVPSATPGDQSDGSIQIYSVSSAADAVLVAEVTGDREPISSSLDSVVWVVDAATNEIVGFDDDGAGGESFDSRAVFSAAAGTTYNVVVDSWFGTNTGAYSLGMSETDDDISAPTPLVIGTPGTGEIADVAGDAFDTDFFVLTLNPGETAHVAITGAGGLQPAVTAVVDTFFGLIPFATGYPVGTDAAIEFAHPSDATDPGEYYIFVDDVRNVMDPDNPADEGAAGYTYTLTASTTTWTATPVTLPYTTAGAIAGVGNYVWYSFTIPAGHMFAASATSTNADFVAGIATLGEGGTASTEIGSASLFPDAETTVTMGVRDQFFRGGAGWDFTPNFRTFDLSAITFTPGAEAEPNDDTATAGVLTPPAGIAGLLDGMGEADLRPDWYRVTATAGQAIGAFTAAGADAGMDDADTVITIYAADGTTVVAENDDYDGQADSFFSAVVATAETAGDYFVVVTPYCTAPDACSGNGDYTVNVFVQ